MTTIKPFRIEWAARSPSYFFWRSVEVMYAGKEFGWHIIADGIVGVERFARRDDALLSAEQTYSLSPVSAFDLV